MPFVGIDHTIAFAIDAPAKASDMQQLDQNVDYLYDQFDASTGHKHNGTDSPYVTDIGANAVDQTAMADSAIGQAELKSTNAVASSSTDQYGVSVVLTGGMYVLGWQTKVTTGDYTYRVYFAVNVLNISYASYVGFKMDASTTRTVYFDHQYVQASPPYNLGNGDIPVFIYALVNNSTGAVDGVTVSEDPPWAYNGPKQMNPHKIFTRKEKKYAGKKYLRRIKRPWTHAEAKADKVKLRANLKAARDKVIEEVEFTQTMKNAGMVDVPQPFASLNPLTHTVVLLDPLSPLCLDFYEMGKEEKEGKTEVAELLHEGRIIIDNTAINGLITPPGVMGVKMRLG